MGRLDTAQVGLTPTARCLWIDFARERDRRLASLPTDRAAVSKRIRDHVARLALLYACDQRTTTIDRPELEAAIAVGHYLEVSYERLLISRQPERGPGRAPALEAIARRLLLARRGTWHSVRDLLRSWPNNDRPGSDELRRALRAMDGVEEQSRQGNRRERYRVRPTARHSTA